jgi:hypothetical protein
MAVTAGTPPGAGCVPPVGVGTAVGTGHAASLVAPTPAEPEDAALITTLC